MAPAASGGKSVDARGQQEPQRRRRVRALCDLPQRLGKRGKESSVPAANGALGRRWRGE